MAELRERLVDVDDVDEPAGCAACGSPDPMPDCWLCGWSWVAEATAAQETADAAEAAALEERFAAIAAVSEAEARVQELTEWAGRLRAVVAAYGPDGRGDRRVELVADLLARVAAVRSSARGRPGMLPLVGAVMAMSSDPRSGRYAMPGRDRTVELAGCRRRATVTEAWARMVGLGWCVRTRKGRRLSLVERRELGRWNDRAEYDLVMLHRSSVDRAGFVPAALAVFAELLDVADGLLRQAHAELDEARARADSWTEHQEYGRRAELRRAVAAARDQARDQADQARNIRTPSSGTNGEYVSSCSSWGFRFSPPTMITSVGCGVRPEGRGKSEGGASRSSTERVRDLDGGGGGSAGTTCGEARGVAHPRRPYGQGRGSPRREAPPWTPWARNLARDLVGLWPWLAGVPLVRVAATVGARLGPDWTAKLLVRWVTSRRDRPVLADPDAPLAYLAALLDDALCGDVAPPFPAAAHTAHRHALAAAHGAVQREHQARQRAAGEEREQNVTRPGRRSTTAEATLAAVRARTSGHLRRPGRAELLDTTAAAGDTDAGDWPEVAQPGEGLPGRSGR